MNFKIRDRMHEIVRDSGLRPARALEVGGYVGDKSLLRSAEIQDAERFGVNLVEQPNDTGIRPVVGNANHMDMFDDGAFDLVLSNAVLEHDKHFWLSLAEMKRIIRPRRPPDHQRPRLRQEQGGQEGQEHVDVSRALPVRLLPVQQPGGP